MLPAYDENAGMAILEAMISGTPALVTENCGYARYLRQAGAGLVTPAPYDQDTFNGQLAELITSDQRADWSRSGRALADDERIYQLAQCAVDLFERSPAARAPSPFACSSTSLSAACSETSSGWRWSARRGAIACAPMCWAGRAMCRRVSTSFGCP